MKIKILFCIVAMALLVGSGRRIESAVQSDFEFPVRLIIQQLGVDAAVEHVGLTTDRKMDVPKNPKNVAWYKPGPRPGDIGSAVIAGHSGPFGNRKDSVFDSLHKLRAGDKLYIEDNKGAIIIFVVRESRNYDPEANAEGVFFSKDGKSHLNLITCEGVWNKITKNYSERLVVFTDRE